MQIDSAGEGSPRSAAAFGLPAAHGTQASRVGAAAAAATVWGLQVELSNWALNWAPGGARK
eukprot:731634-Prymnesium_polylepis.1